MSNSDSELDEDEEEILVYVEFDSCATNDMFSNENLKLDILGLDSDHPVMQVNGKFFEGTYEDAVGTYLFFEKDDNPPIDDPVFDRIPSLKYYHKTRKVLKMQRAFVIPRNEVVGDSEHNKCIPNIETIREAGVAPKYQEEALAFWQNARGKRTDAINDYLKKQEFRKELRLRGFEPESDSDEDHPFAMYKSLAKEPEDIFDDNLDLNSQIESLENTLQMTELDNEVKSKVSQSLTVIDPGPSTSKSSMPWIEDDVPQEQVMSHKVKSIGKVKEKTIKGRVHKRIGRKKKISISQGGLNENPEDQSEECNVNESESDINQTPNDDTEEAKKLLRKQKIKVEQMEVDEEVIDESGRLLSEELGMGDSYVSDKQKRKQEKREAKMREISEKLKALGQNSSQPNS